MTAGVLAALDAVAAVPVWQSTSTQTRAEIADLLTARARLDALLADRVHHAETAGLLDERQRLQSYLADAAPHPLPPAELDAHARRARGRDALPLLTGLHSDGQISTAYLDAALAGLAALPADCASTLDTVLATGASELTPRQVHALVRQLRTMVDPDGADTAAADAVDTAYLSRYGSDDRYDLRATLSAGPGSHLAAVLAALAAPTGPDDQRSPAQRRAAALTQMARLAAATLGQDTEETPGSANPDRMPVPPHGLDAHLIVLTTLDALQGTPGAPAPVTADGATLDPAYARALACTSPLTPAVITPTGHAGDAEADQVRRTLAGLLPAPLATPAEPLHLGRTARTASRAQWLALVLRDRTCRYPGCSRGPTWCQAHHLLEWDADCGPTDLDNLALLCWEHHTALHRRHEHLTPVGDGTYTLTDPHSARQCHLAA